MRSAASVGGLARAPLLRQGVGGLVGELGYVALPCGEGGDGWRPPDPSSKKVNTATRSRQENFYYRLQTYR